MLIQNGGRFANVDHRLHREEHPLLEPHASTGFAEMENIRRGMKNLAQAMTAIFTHHAVTKTLGIGLNGVANIAGGGAGRMTSMPFIMAA